MFSKPRIAKGEEVKVYREMNVGGERVLKQQYW